MTDTSLKNYFVGYTVFSRKGDLLSKGTLMAMRKISAEEAKIKTKEHLKKKHDGAYTVQIHSVFQYEFADIN